eukprot:CAMPEP_0170444676 /NCGR_PEP_ID=MMETSP0117_2-20130122/48658_1 /TAXON_ID=400756 /ORGANISM="Durinskia baltica, Strain CSIRO CS-38" /LENGTH=69 /DNA_ID=CAMNT_0010705507 /DNA_START=37 /DNA_END=246 /DNA_ORIENTATION=+
MPAEPRATESAHWQDRAGFESGLRYLSATPAALVLAGHLKYPTEDGIMSSGSRATKGPNVPNCIVASKK